jgi:hypothetical protein
MSHDRSEVHAKQLKHESNDNPQDGMGEILLRWIGKSHVVEYLQDT